MPSLGFGSTARPVSTLNASIGGGGGGGGALSGSVTNSSGGAGIVGAVIERYTGGVLQDTATTDGSGNYSFASANVGDVVRCHSPLAAMCADDAGEFTVSGSTQNFLLQTPPEPWRGVVTHGSNISDATDLRASTGSFWSNGCNARGEGTWGEGAGAGSISLNTTGGPSSGKALQYNFPARPSTGCFVAQDPNCEITIAYQPRIFGYLPDFHHATPTLVGGEIWLMKQDWFPSGWKHGRDGCAPIAYKHFLVNFESGSHASRLGAYWGRSFAVDPEHFALTTDWTTSDGGTGFGPAAQTDYGTAFAGAHARWVWGVTGIGTSSAVAKLYRNGVLLHTTPTCNILPGLTVGSGWAITLELGANMNNGPTNAQTCRVTGWGLYPKRPGLLLAA